MLLEKKSNQSIFKHNVTINIYFPYTILLVSFIFESKQYYIQLIYILQRRFIYKIAQISSSQASHFDFVQKRQREFPIFILLLIEVFI